MGKEFTGILDSLQPRYRKIEIILTDITDEDYEKLLKAVKVKVVIEE